MVAKSWESAVKKKAQPAKSKVANKLSVKVAEAAKVGQAIGAAKEPHKYQPGFKRPKTLALAADELWKTRVTRLAEQKQVDAIEAREKDWKAYLVEELPKQLMSTVGGKLASVTLKSKNVPRAEDWTKLYAGIVKEYLAHIKKKDGMEDSAFAILGRSLSEATVQEMWDGGKAVPGIVAFPVTSLSINKV